MTDTPRPAASDGAIMVNRAPVLTLWAAIVAERLGFDHDEALTLGRAVAGMNAYRKGVSLGLFTPAPEEVRRERERHAHGATLHVDLLNRAVPVLRTPDGWRAVSKDKPTPPEGVQRYLASKFGDALVDVEAAMRVLAASLTADELAARAYALYERFRPDIPEGVKGWGAAGALDLERIRGAAQPGAPRRARAKPPS